MKLCTKCKTEKPATLEFFKPEKRTADGLNWQCRDCTRKADKRYKTGAAGQAAIMRWNASDAHREQLKKCKADPERNERIREYNHEWKVENNPRLSRYQKHLGLQIAAVFAMLPNEGARERFAVDLMVRNSWFSDDAQAMNYHRADDWIAQHDLAIHEATRYAVEYRYAEALLVA